MIQNEGFLDNVLSIHAKVQIRNHNNTFVKLIASKHCSRLSKPQGKAGILLIKAISRLQNHSQRLSAIRHWQVLDASTFLVEPHSEATQSQSYQRHYW